MDEDAITQSLLAEGAGPRDIVDTLAEHKARKGASKMPGLVLGCDQILVFDRGILGKPKSRSDLAETLARLQGQTHRLMTANVLYKDGQPIWRHVGIVKLTMMQLSDAEIADYITAHWDTAQHAAGGYVIENTPYLFDKIEGDWFDILGLSIDPVIAILQQHGTASEAARPKLAGVLGYPIKHSKSPKLHGHWLQAYHIPGLYTALETPPARFEGTIAMLRHMGFAGVNVTIPHKESALRVGDRITDAARHIGASNTLVFTDDDITADNTDGYGFIENLRQKAPDWDAAAGPAYVLGAGGAARAILWALLQAGVPKIYLTNRTRQKADQLRSEFGDKVHVVDWDECYSVLPDTHTLVNTTALGMTGQPPLEMDLAGLPATALVTDIVYTPLQTPLLAEAAQKGCMTVDGVGMLLHQAAPGFRAWFGTDPKVTDDLRRAVLA